MRIIKNILIVVLLLVIGLAGFGYWSFRNGNLQKVVVNEVSKQLVKNPFEKNLLQTVLGFEKPRTYLILFSNSIRLSYGESDI